MRAQNADIPTRYHNLLDYKKRYPGNTTQARAEFDKDLAKHLLEDCPDLVVCAGWYVSNYTLQLNLLMACRMHGAWRIVALQFCPLIFRASLVPRFPKSARDCQHTNNKPSSSITWRVQWGCKFNLSAVPCQPSSYNLWAS